MKTIKYKMMNYKKVLSLIAIVATSVTAMGQTNNTEGVSISSGVTPPHPSAMLDVSSTNKGVLIPRVSLTGETDNVTIPTPANSLLVYNTNTVGSFTEGYYYWDDTQQKWLQLGGSGANNGFWQQTPSSNSIHFSNAGDVGIKTGNDIPRADLDIKGSHSSIIMGGGIPPNNEFPNPTDLWFKLQTDNAHAIIETSEHGLLVGWYNHAHGNGLNPVSFFTPVSFHGGHTIVSDSILKKNVQPLTNNLSIVSQLAPKSYERNDCENSKTYCGFIAQEVETILPSLVSPVKAPDFPNLKGINYIEIIPILTGAIQEQQAIIEQLEQRIEALENQ